MPYQYGPPVLTEDRSYATRECDSCGQEIQQGEPAVEVFRGVLGIGRQSGQPVVTSDPEIDSLQVETTGIVHIECILDYARDNLYDDSDEQEEPGLCWSCQRELGE